MTIKKRKRYDKEFKTMVVNLCLSGKSTSEVASDMDLDRRMVYRWVSEQTQFKENSFKGNGNPVRTAEQEEITELKAELRKTQIERDILKKAVSIFSKSDSTNMNL
ncbi:transposase [Halosquirtibacter laminarini]|uniref:Transposase n=4 Tax=Halosquirtibacter laminarini TaxID=3374600 RepID=A0AC61NB14_9BACT|nr:transposase [Prolixibacteraceae bacterium]QZE14954.1 transposase [Prolixibacteraceae bacterium]QZE15305.1 transposase [Prolixibacteraceae bacterium]QZE15898.1 transposase [Prolixibacteraceae bacterium]